MSNRFRFISALGAVFFAVAGLSACGGGIPGNAVVQVGGNSITKASYEHWLSVAAASSSAAAPGQTAPKPVVPDPPHYTACIAHLEATAPKPAKGQSKPTATQLKSQCEQQYKSLQQEVLGFLISSSWVLGEAQSQGVKVSDAEVRKQFEQIKNQQFPKPEEFKKFLATSGQSISDLLLRVKLNLLSSKIQQKVSKKGAVTQAQINKYYNEHKSQFGTPEKRNVKIILTKTEAQAKKAKQEIESGKSFSSVAKAVSVDPTSKAKGGEITGVVKGQEEKTLDEAIFSAKKGVLGGPIKTPFGYYIYEVTGTTTGNQQTLTQAQASIKQQLTAQQQQQALSKFVKEFRSRWEAKTECRSGYVVQDCHEYKKPKTPTTPTAPATPQTSTPQTTSTPNTTTTK